MKLFLPTLVSTERITRDMWFLGILHITLATHCYVCDGESCLDPWKNVKDADQYKQDCNDFGFIEDGGCSKRKYYDAESKVYMGKLLSCVCAVHLVHCGLPSSFDRLWTIYCVNKCIWWTYSSENVCPCSASACTVQYITNALWWTGHWLKSMLNELNKLKVQAQMVISSRVRHSWRYSFFRGFFFWTFWFFSFIVVWWPWCDVFCFFFLGLGSLYKHRRITLNLTT